MTALPTNISFGKVRGRFGSPILSAGDADGLPDFQPLTGLEVIFTPKPDIILNLGASPVPVTFLTEAITCTLDDDGYLVGPDGREGVNLIATNDTDLAPTGWTYKVSFGGNLATYKRLQTFDISVPADSTRWLTAIAPVPSSSGSSTLDEVQAAVLQMNVAVGQAHTWANTAEDWANAASASASSAAASTSQFSVDNLPQAGTTGKALMKASSASVARAAIGAQRASVLNIADYAAANGTTDDTAAVQALITGVVAGSVIEVPAGVVVKLSDTLTIAAAGVTIRGPGELRWASGITNKPAMKVTGNKVSITNLAITNPTELGAKTGNRNIGIDIRAHDASITGCTIDRFQHGVLVGADGEWMRARIRGNTISNVIGAGSGSTTDDGFGEDRSDGITVWGGRAVITDNIVFAKPGTDARIGIHAESLTTFIVTADSGQDSGCTIANNIVYGPFRRGITLEDVDGCTVTGNVVSDATWWGINLSGGGTDKCYGAVVQGNTINWTRTASDTQGAGWAPRRGPIMLYRNIKGASIANNTVRVAATGVAEYFLLGQSVSGEGISDCTITGNTITILSGGVCLEGMIFADGASSTIGGNRIKFTATSSVHSGISSTGCNGFVVDGNSVEGPGTSFGRGIYHTGTPSISITSNIVREVALGAACINSTSGATIWANSFSNSAVGVDLFGTTGRCMVQNRFGAGVTTQYNNTSYTGNQSFTMTKHAAALTPSGGQSGDIFVGTGKIWVNDAGTWKSATIA